MYALSSQTPSESPSRWREFLSGAVEPSFPALSGAVLVAGLLFLSCALFLTSDLLATVDCGYFMVKPDDDYAYLSSEVMHLNRSPSRQPAVAFIGASATREVVGKGDELAALLGERLGEPAAVHQLSAAGMTHWEAAQIADCIAQAFEGVIVFEVSPVKLAFPRWRLEELVNTPRLALDSPALDGEIRLAGFEPPRRMGNFFLDHYGFFSARPTALVNVLRGPVAPDFHQARTWRRLTEAEWEGALDWLWLRIERYSENGAYGWEVLGRSIERLRQSGEVKVVLLESVRNPRAERLLRESDRTRPVLEQYEKDVAAFAETRGVPYWNVSKEAGLDPGDFTDTSHVRDPEATQRYIERLAERLAVVLEPANRGKERTE